MHYSTPHSLPTVTHAPRRRRWICVVLLGLAWLQLAYASHQFEHAAGDFADSCAVCSNFERLEHSVSPAMHAMQLPQGHPVLLPAPAWLSYTRFDSHCLPRAPPVV